MECFHCQVNLDPRTNRHAVEETDCKSSFVNIHSYFNACVLRCINCNVYYLKGYYEDFTNTDFAEEFGDRYLIVREISKEEFETILSHQDKNDLDLNSFGVKE